MADSKTAEPVAAEGALMRGAERLSALTLEQPLGECVAVLLLCPILLWIAIWNGFPLIFYDTGAYLLEGLRRVFLIERSPVYSLFLDYAGAGRNFWYVAILQALMTAFTMTAFVRAERPRMPVWMLAALGVALTLLTSIGWNVGQLEPDFMAALLVLGLYLLAFRAERLGWFRCAALAAITALSIACHPSHLGLAAGLVFALALLRLAIRYLPRLHDAPRPLLAPPSLCFALAISLVLAANHALTGAYFITRSGPVFMFTRMLQDGIVKRLLDDTCPGSHYVLCRYKDQLPTRGDAWLWQRGSIFNKLHRFAGTSDESERIVIDSLERYPMMQVRAVLADTALQFFMVQTGDGIEPQEWVLQRGFRQLIPRQVDAYMNAHQQRGDIRFFLAVNIVQLAVASLTLLALIYALRNTISRRDWDGLSLPAFLLLALLGNAFICGVMSNPHDRYQSRLVWPVVFALAATVKPKAVFSLRRPVESVT